MQLHQAGNVQFQYKQLSDLSEDVVSCVYECYKNFLQPIVESACPGFQFTLEDTVDDMYKPISSPAQ
ncbi:hypothetical protein BVRB_040640, partial [Beta vulgaris subsp. vulgaris]